MELFQDGRINTRWFGKTCFPDEDSPKKSTDWFCHFTWKLSNLNSCTRALLLLKSSFKRAPPPSPHLPTAHPQHTLFGASDHRAHTFDTPKEQRMSYFMNSPGSIFHPGGCRLFIEILLTICHGCEIKPEALLSTGSYMLKQEKKNEWNWWILDCFKWCQPSLTLVRRRTSLSRPINLRRRRAQLEQE